MISSSNVSTVTKSGPIVPGHRVVVTMDNIELNEKGDIIFTAHNDTGAFKHMHFNNNATRKPKSQTKEDIDHFNTANARTFQRTVHIFSAFVPKAELDQIKAANYTEWRKAACKLFMRNNGVGKEVTIHAIVNDNNYVALPAFDNCVSSDIHDCKWVSNPDKHKYVFSEIKAKPDVEPTPSLLGDDATDEENPLTF